MNARSIMLLCALFAPALAFAQQPVSASALENRFWQTLKQNDLTALKATMTPDYLSVEDGVSTRDQVIANLSHCRLDSFNLSELREQAVSAGVVATVYRLRTQATCGDKHYDGVYIATTVWALRNGQWLAQLHTEHPLDDKK
jgi:hypothetical protein